MTCFVYVIGSDSDCGRGEEPRDGKTRPRSGRGGGSYRTYVGWTNDLERRLKAHNTGAGARSTRGRAWILLYAETHANKSDAMSREWHIKRDRKFRKMLSSNQI